MFRLIVNPNAGRGKKKKQYRRVLARMRERGLAFSVSETHARGEAKELARQACEAGEDVIVVGGDGTLHEALNGFCNFERCALGLIPLGTGNDFAAAAKIPEDPVRAVDLIADGAPQFTEYMQMPQGVRGINVIGTGIDVEILRRCRRCGLFRGKTGYLLSLIVSLIKFRNYELTARFNGKEERYKTLIACIGNGYRIGGGIRMCPAAVLGDGLLDFVAVDNVKKSRIIPAFIRLMKGRILEESFTRFERCEHLEVVPEKPLTVQVDGELYDGLPFVVDIVKDRLRMYRG